MYKKMSIAILISCFVIPVYAQNFYAIPEQKISLSQILGLEMHPNDIDTIKDFVISSQVTFGEYKVYLQDIKNDSPYIFYLSQLPDSSISSKKNYTIYITNEDYNNYPVAGITWDAALQYCKWRTMKESRDGKYDNLYRLPVFSEWLAAYHYLQDNDTTNDFNKDYSDWTMSWYFDNIIYMPGAIKKNIADIVVFSKNEPMHMKRKIVMGDSYLFQTEKLRGHLRGYFSDNGYRQVAFRIVKEKISPQRLTFLQKGLFKYWGL